MKFKELKTKSEKELQKILSDLRHNLREQRFKIASNQLKNIREIRQTKKTIAKILFLMALKKQKVNEVK